MEKCQTKPSPTELSREAELEEVRDEFLAKKGLLKYLVEESQNWGLPAAEANSVMETMRSHRQVRAKFQEGADLSWMQSAC